MKSEQRGLTAPVVTEAWKESSLSLPAAKRNNPPRFSFLLTVFLFILPAISAQGQTVTTTVAVGTEPIGTAVNPVTNKIYVANFQSGNVTVIDGATNSTSTVTAGINPLAVAMNPVTNKVYVSNAGTTSVTEIDGASNSTSTVTVGSSPEVVATN